MKKILKNIIFTGLVMVLLSGCSFIVAEGDKKIYYGMDEHRGDQFLNQILEIQDQLAQAKKEAIQKK